MRGPRLVALGLAALVLMAPAKRARTQAPEAPPSPAARARASQPDPPQQAPREQEREDRRRERVLALAPHIVETLFAIGAGDQIVGAVRFSDYPPEARSLPRVGSYKAVAVEAALRLQPTLVLAMDASVAGLDRLRALGLRTELSHPETVLESIQNVVRMGRLLDREREANQLAARLLERLKRVRARRPARPIRVFYEIWHQPLVTAGGRSFISDALSELGARNIFADLPLADPRVSIEAVLRQAPDAIVIPGESRDLGERERIWRRWFSHDPGLRIVQAEHELLHRPGPRLIEGMERLQQQLLQRADGAASAK